MESDICLSCKAFLRLSFLSTLSAWRATQSIQHNIRQQKPFLSTLSAWRATVCAKRLCAFFQISIHALRMESDAAIAFVAAAIACKISIHALRMESDDDSMPVEDVAADISIHALRMESDVTRYLFAYHVILSIHALRMESDVLRPVTVRTFTKEHDGILSFAA